MTNPRIYLSPPDAGETERALLLDAFDSNWLAPNGPHVDGFESAFVDAVGLPHALAVSSGTAGLHLALRALDVGPGDEVLVSDLTFIASASAIVYQGARPVFIDADVRTWNLDPGLLAEELAERARRGRLPRAVVVVDLYGQCADYDAIMAACDEYGVPVVEDAAEALGATYRGRAAGSFGRIGVFSFNGNKIITTSGGGMVLTGDAALARHMRHLASQAREPVAHYEHLEVGYNYRLSNVLAAIGRGQLQNLPAKVAARRAVNARYQALLGDVAGIDFMPEADYGVSNRWLTVVTIDPILFGVDREAVRNHLEQHDIESRPAWKPMHLQPVFAGFAHRGGAVGAAIFERGLCLPSGSSLRDDQVERIAELVLSTPGASSERRPLALATASPGSSAPSGRPGAP